MAPLAPPEEDPVLKVILPVTPEVPASAVCSTRLPLLVAAPEPEVIDTSPPDPVVDLPATIDTFPPVVEPPPLPTDRVRSPPAVEPAPVDKVIAPPGPPVEVPELRYMAPPVDLPEPEVMVTVPPEEESAEESPEKIFTAPPSPVLPEPTDRVIAPPAPPVPVPVDR
jgi:hypothetical protein